MREPEMTGMKTTPTEVWLKSFSASRTEGVAWYAGIIIALGLFLSLCAYQITLPGIHYDEVLQAPAAIILLNEQVNADYNKGWSPTFAGRTLPLLSMEYMGAIKSYLLAAAFHIFGVKVTVLRMTMILLALPGLIFTALLAGEWLGWRSALASVWLTATDPSLIMLTRADVGPIVIAFSLRMAAMFLAWRWWISGGRPTLLVAASALLGLGVYDKTNFLWFVIALTAIGVFAWLFSKERPALTSVNLASAVLAFFVASAPLWLFNLRRDWITFRMAVLPGESFSFARLIEMAPARTETLFAVLKGRFFDSVMLDQQMPSILGFSGSLLLPLSLLSVVILVTVGLFKRRWRLLALPALMAIILAQTYVTPRPVTVWHWIVIYPFPQLAVGMALAGWRQGAWAKWQTILRPTFALAVMFAIILNVCIMARYHRLIRDTGGARFWSDAIYRLNDTLQAEYAGRPIQLMDWGIGNQLFFLSSGKLHLCEPFWAYTSAPQPDERLVRLAADTANVFIIHDGSSTAFPDALAAFSAAVKQACVEVKIERQFADRRSQAVFKLLEFSPAQCR